MSEVAINSLKEALSTKSTDKLEIGDVIRWTGAGRYTYAAIKTSAGWFTTARGYNGNGFVAKEYDYEGLVEMLSKSDVTEVMVSTGWAEVV